MGLDLTDSPSKYLFVNDQTFDIEGPGVFTRGGKIVHKVFFLEQDKNQLIAVSYRADSSLFWGLYKEPLGGIAHKDAYFCKYVTSHERLSLLSPIISTFLAIAGSVLLMRELK